MHMFPWHYNEKIKFGKTWKYEFWDDMKYPKTASKLLTSKRQIETNQGLFKEVLL